LKIKVKKQPRPFGGSYIMPLCGKKGTNIKGQKVLLEALKKAREWKNQEIEEVSKP